MEEIKVGEYVRTKTGNITKVISGKDTVVWTEDFIDVYCRYNEGIIEKTDIIKHSPNIKDVLETGDIIEHKIYQEIFKSEIYITNKDEIFTTDGERILPEEIISVVTHEIFNQVKYEV